MARKPLPNHSRLFSQKKLLVLFAILPVALSGFGLDISVMDPTGSAQPILEAFETFGPNHSSLSDGLLLRVDSSVALNSPISGRVIYVGLTDVLPTFFSLGLSAGPGSSPIAILVIEIGPGRGLVVYNLIPSDLAPGDLVQPGQPIGRANPIGPVGGDCYVQLKYFIINGKTDQIGVEDLAWLFWSEPFATQERQVDVEVLDPRLLGKKDEEGASDVSPRS